MRRPLVKPFEPPAPPPSIPDLLDRLQEAAIDLGSKKAIGTDYSRAVASQKLTEARRNAEAGILAEAVVHDQAVTQALADHQTLEAAE